jgi:hypothetical protein
MKKEVKIMNMNTRYMESTGRTRQVTPRMMEYLGHVIDTPTVGAYGDNGKVIGKKMDVTRNRIGSFRSAFVRMFTKEEVLELCEEVMKETA